MKRNLRRKVYCFFRFVDMIEMKMSCIADEEGNGDKNYSVFSMVG
jgi:hypothetical protein